MSDFPVSQKRKYRSRRRFGLRLLLCLGLLWFWQVVLLVVLVNAYGRVDRAQPADVIIVLGAGLRQDNTPGPALTRRSLYAASLWQQELAPVIICAGGKPGNRTRSEADACAEVLLAEGVPANAIIQEDQSRSTEENALYIQVIMEANGWNDAILVSDGYHLLRASYIFSGRDIIAYPSPVPNGPSDPIEYAVFMGREIVALHWQVVKELFHIPITYVQSI